VAETVLEAIGLGKRTAGSGSRGLVPSGAGGVMGL
jgi:hypothetical protein